MDEFGRPLYGDVFGSTEKATVEVLAEGLSREPWAAMEEEEEEEEEEEDDDDDEGGDHDGSIATDDDIAEGISSVTSTTPSGLATPDAIQLRKTFADGVGTPSAHSTATGLDTPDGSEAAPQLYQILQQTDARVGSSAFGSSHGYVVPPPPSVGAPSASGGKRKAGGEGGVELALDPSELGQLDEAALKARYEQLRKAERDANAPEDVSDIIEEQERKRKRKLDAQRAADKKGGR